MGGSTQPKPGKRMLLLLTTLAGMLALLAALLVPALAQAKPARITGKLSAPRYTVIAMAASGEVKTGRTRHGKFKLRPPAKRVTLHLRAPDATYAGPIVVATQGEDAIVGVRAGAKLGKIRVDQGDGYATLARRLPRKYVDVELTASAENGIPIGARNLGRVLVGEPGGPSSDSTSTASPPPSTLMTTATSSSTPSTASPAPAPRAPLSPRPMSWSPGGPC